MSVFIDLYLRSTSVDEASGFIWEYARGIFYSLRLTIRIVWLVIFAK